MDATEASKNLTSVEAHELELVARLLAVMSPVESGPHPGAQLSRSRSGRVWTIRNDTTTVDVRSSGSICGLEQPVWMTERSVLFAAGCADRDGWCDIGIDDRREVDATVAALIEGRFTQARIDLPTQPSVSPLRPSEAGVLATGTTDMTALLNAVHAASLTPVGVPVSGPPVGTFELEHDALVIVGTDRRGVDRAAEFRLDAAIELDIVPAIWVQVDVELAPLVEIGQHLPAGEVIVTLTSDGELWLIAGPCRVVIRGEVRRLEPDDLDCVVYLVGRVEGTDEPVLSVHGGCPVDDTIVWLESEPDEYGPLEWFERFHAIVWYAEPAPYGVSAIDK